MSHHLRSFLVAGVVIGCACSPTALPSGDVVARWIADDPQTFLSATDLLGSRLVGDLCPATPAAIEKWRGHDVELRSLDGGGLEIVRRGADPWVAVDTRIDADEIAAVEVELTNPGPAEAQLFWVRRWQRFSMSRMARPDASRVLGSGRVLYRFEVANHHGWNGKLRSLRIDVSPGADRPTRLGAVRLYRKWVDEEAIRNAAQRPWKIELGRVTKSSLLSPSGSSWVQTLTVPDHATLIASYGLQRGALRPTTFRITADTGDEGPKVLFEDAVSGVDRWRRAIVDLAPLAGRRVAVSLTTTAAEAAEPPCGVPVWGTPEIVAPGRIDTRPNVVIVLLDTLRADRLSCYGYDLETSPHIDAWAATSAFRFANTVAPAPWTLPSHASLFTGLDALHHGFDSWGMAPDDFDMVAEVFRRNGYTTAAITGGGVLHPSLGFSQGFDEFSAWDIPDSRDEVGWVFASARRWLEQNRHRRFFLFVHTYEVHAPHRRRQPYFRRLSDEAGIEPAQFEVNLVARPWQGLVAGGDRFVVRRPGSDDWTPDLSELELQTVGLMYDSAVATVDAEVGELLGHLERLGLTANTAVVVTSDHGEALGEEGRAGHSYLKDYNLMVPLLVSIPGVSRERPVIDDQVRLLDLMPTLLDIAGLDVSGPVDGRSLTPLMKGSSIAPSRPAWSYAASSNRGLALRIDNQLKYVFPDAAWAELSHREQLFEVATDPKETINLAPADPRLDALRATTSDTIRSQHGGLRLEIRNAENVALAGRLTGAWAAHNRVKTADHDLDWIHWTPRSQASFELEPGEAATLLFTQLDSPQAGLVLRLGASGDLAATQESVTFDLETIQMPAAYRFVGGGWRLDEAFDGQIETGCLITRASTRLPVVSSGIPEDLSLIERLKALGYVD